MRIVDLIIRKRDGRRLSRDEIDAFISGVTTGEIPDYQASALLMAIFLRGLDAEETGWLTDAMVRSGGRVDLSSLPGVKVGKHSTGGVGDKTSLVVVPRGRRLRGARAQELRPRRSGTRAARSTSSSRFPDSGSD